MQTAGGGTNEEWVNELGDQNEALFQKTADKHKELGIQKKT
jgi:hypothetical protein